MASAKTKVTVKSPAAKAAAARRWQTCSGCGKTRKINESGLLQPHQTFVATVHLPGQLPLAAVPCPGSGFPPVAVDIVPDDEDGLAVCHPGQYAG